jgi:hypothetical protein
VLLNGVGTGLGDSLRGLFFSAKVGEMGFSRAVSGIYNKGAREERQPTRKDRSANGANSQNAIDDKACPFKGVVWPFALAGFCFFAGLGCAWLAARWGYGWGIVGCIVAPASLIFAAIGGWNFGCHLDPPHGVSHSIDIPADNKTAVASDDEPGFGGLLAPIVRDVIGAEPPQFVIPTQSERLAPVISEYVGKPDHSVDKQLCPIGFDFGVSFLVDHLGLGPERSLSDATWFYDELGRGVREKVLNVSVKEENSRVHSHLHRAEDSGRPSVVFYLNLDNWLDRANWTAVVIVNLEGFESSGDTLVADEGVQNRTFQIDESLLRDPRLFLGSLGAVQARENSAAIVTPLKFPGFPQVVSGILEEQREQRDGDAGQGGNQHTIGVERDSFADKEVANFWKVTGLFWVAGVAFLLAYFIRRGGC